MAYVIFLYNATCTVGPTYYVAVDTRMGYAVCFMCHLCLCPYFPYAYNTLTLHSIPFSFHYASGPRMAFLFHTILILLINAN